MNFIMAINIRSIRSINALLIMYIKNIYIISFLFIFIQSTFVCPGDVVQRAHKDNIQKTRKILDWKFLPAK